MKWIRDKSGRFPQRPYYEDHELDLECESVITSFLLEKYGKVVYPLTTNDLTILVEQSTSDLDLYADLSKEGNDVEGMTLFMPTGKPKVYVTQRLSDQVNRENRLRTTLAHEFGHVKLHGFLTATGQPSFFGATSQTLIIKCKRDTIIGATETDWMEWQAGYASGAYLMPITPIREMTQQAFEKANSPSVEMTSSPVGQALIQQVSMTFRVSEDAARVRLIKLGYLTNKRMPNSLLNQASS